MPEQREKVKVVGDDDESSTCDYRRDNSARRNKRIQDSDVDENLELMDENLGIKVANIKLTRIVSDVDNQQDEHAVESMEQARSHFTKYDQRCV